MANLKVGTGITCDGATGNINAGVGIVTAKGGLVVGSAATIYSNGNISCGVITATSYSGGVGKILQVVSTTTTATDSVSVATTAWGDLGPTRAITPSATDSKILITAVYVLSTSLTNMNLDCRLDGGGSVITGATGDAASSRKRGTVSMQHTHSEDTAILTVNFLHSPSTDASITYKLQFGHNSNSTRTIYLNRCQADTDDAKLGRFTSTLTCMEIGA